MDCHAKMDKIIRKKTRKISLGKLFIGGDAPISIQSMLNTKTLDIAASGKQIQALASAGCEIIRFSVASVEDALAIKKLREFSSLPLIADIHFDHKLALLAIANGIDGLRINPGNIGSRDKVKEVVAAASEQKIPIRIGVNSGSLPKHLIQKYGVSAKAMVEAALEHIHILEDLHYQEMKISVKASTLDLMLQSYRELSRSVDYPLHLGLTEAGTIRAGTVKSSIAMGILFSEGIGDTFRVSLTADPVQEVLVARDILQTLNLRQGLNIISCPTCGRTNIDLIALTKQVEDALSEYKDHALTIAVMGCAVNGPGEAREADFGIAGGSGEALLFAKGEIIRKVPESEVIPTLLDLIRKSKCS